MILLDLNNITSKFFYSKSKVKYDFYDYINRLLDMDNHICGCYDGKWAGVFKKQKYPKYKSNRSNYNVDLDYLEACINVMKNMGLTTLSHEELEADDLILGIAVASRHVGYNDGILIISEDIDLYQAYYFIENIDVEDVNLFHYENEYGKKRIEFKFNKFKNKIMCGDKSDNLVSIKKLIKQNQFDDVDNLLSIVYFPYYFNRDSIIQYCLQLNFIRDLMNGKQDSLF